MTEMVPMNLSRDYSLLVVDDEVQLVELFSEVIGGLNEVILAIILKYILKLLLI